MFMERKCVALISGGLDSALAARLMLEQGIEVSGLYLSLSWGCCDKQKAVAAAHQLGVPLMVLNVGEAYLEVIRHPKRSEEHTSELQSQSNLVCRLLLEKKK